MDNEMLEAARAVAFRYLGYTARSRSELERRLERADFPPEVIAAVVVECEGFGWVDDAEFARRWIEDRADRKQYGRTRLAAELKRKGVEKEQVAEALGQVDEEAELARAREAARGKWRWNAEEGAEPAALDAEKRRVANFLQRRGFSWGIVRQVIAELAANKE